MFKSKRICVNIGIFGSFLFLPFVPWYVLFIAGVLATWYFTYYEFIFLGFLIDLSYDSKQFFTVHGMQYPLPYMTLIALIFVVLHLVKKRVRF